MKRIPGTVILLVCFVFAGCELDQPSNEKVAIGIREDIALHMMQTLDPPGPGLSFIFKSLSTFNCEDAGFEYKLTTSQGQIQIDLLKVDIPVPCTGGNAFAVEQINLPGYQGIYSLAINMGGNIENTGTLVIDQKGYRLYMDTQDGISIPYTAMHRIPQGVVWGYVYNNQQQTQSSIKLNELIAPYVQNTNLEEGYYGHFYASDSKEISLPLPSDKASAFPFAFSFNGSAASLTTLAGEIRQQLPSGSELQMLAWNGGVY